MRNFFPALICAMIILKSSVAFAFVDGYFAIQVSQYDKHLPLSGMNCEISQADAGILSKTFSDGGGFCLFPEWNSRFGDSLVRVTITDPADPPRYIPNRTWLRENVVVPVICMSPIPKESLPPEPKEITQTTVIVMSESDYAPISGALVYWDPDPDSDDFTLPREDVLTNSSGEAIVGPGATRICVSYLNSPPPFIATDGKKYEFADFRIPSPAEKVKIWLKELPEPEVKIISLEGLSGVIHELENLAGFPGRQ
jgi:hypothetical protein